MKINKIINNLYYGILLLVPLGWFLNGKYYFSRFMSEGFDSYLCWIIPAALVVFASFLFGSANFLKQKKSKIWFLFLAGYFVLAIYSINCTAAGQYWDQQRKNREIKTDIIDKENTAYFIERYQEKITDLETEYNKLNEMRNKTLDDLSDLYNWKNTTKAVEQMKTEIKTELKEYENKLENLIKENKVSAKNKDNIQMSKTLYIFYSKIFNLKGESPEENVQFIFQIILSIIIESIAQLSILIFMKIKFFNVEKSEIKTPGKIYTPVQISQNELKHFTIIAWDGINRKQSKALTNKSTLLNVIKKMCPGFTPEKYNEIIMKAFRKNLVKHDKTGWYPASGFVDQEFFYKKMCEYMKFT